MAEADLPPEESEFDSTPHQELKVSEDEVHSDVIESIESQPDLRRRIARAAGGMIVVLSGAAAGLLTTPPQPFEAGPLEGTISLDKTLSVTGGTSIDFSVFGGIDLPSHRGIGIDIELTDIKGSNEPETIPAHLRDLKDTSKEFETAISDAIEKMIVAAALRALGGAALASTGMLLASGRKNYGHVLRVAGVGTLAGGLAIAAPPFFTYNESALKDATYRGLTSFASQFVGDTTKILSAYPKNFNQLADMLDYFGELREATLNSQSIPDGAVGILVTGDRHCGTGLGALEEAILKTDDRIVARFDNGDLTEVGSEVENTLCFSDLSKLDTVPLVIVRGNHDQAITENFLKSKGVTVANMKVRQVKGFTVIGQGETTASVLAENGNEEAPITDEQLDKIRSSLEEAGMIDIFMAHRPEYTEAARGKADLVITGHTHKLDISAEDGTLFVNPGTFGAGGNRAFSGDKPQQRTAAIVYFKDGKPVGVSKLNLGIPGSLNFGIEYCAVDLEENKVYC